MRSHRYPTTRRRGLLWALALIGVAIAGAALFKPNAAPSGQRNVAAGDLPTSVCVGGTVSAEGDVALQCKLALPAPSTSPSASPSPSSSPTTPPSPTASPSPSTTPSPSPSTTAPATTPPASPTPTGPQTQCLKLPSRCGFPDDTNTGPNGASTTYITNNRFGIYEYGHSNDCVGDHVSAWSGNVVDATNAPLGAA